MTHIPQQIHHSYPKELIMKSGIYIIVNRISGEAYIGSAREFKDRWERHISSFLGKKPDKKTGRIGHENQILQRTWDKYGHDIFLWFVVELCPEEALIEREQIWINSFLELKLPIYNIRKIANSNFGLKCSEETKRKMSEAAIRRGDNINRDASWRKKISEANKANVESRCGQEMRNKISKLKKGNTFAKGLIWISQENTSKRIKKEELSDYLQNGWTLGRVLKPNGD